ncbi:MAG: hypothetical protein BVN31_07130 [Proteobacteria bacterium ST_bin15]|nr:MAG: hypothetical protein BVN31_07130 [Proteobacteria bacterium ST_bin15]
MARYRHKAVPDATSTPPRLLFLVPEDWFFVSHFIGMGIAARQAGFDVAIATPVRAHRLTIEAAGIRVIDVDRNRVGMGPLSLLRTIDTFRRIIAAEEPDIIHCIALRTVLTGGLAARLTGVRGTVLAPTGLGFLWSNDHFAARMARRLIRFIVSHVLDTPRTLFLFENPDDARALGLDPDDRSKITLVRGAGVEPAAFPPQPPRHDDTLRLAVVARMIASKRIADAVAAVGLAQAAGHRVSLDIYGAPDPVNPASYTQAELDAWSRLPGITWKGPTRDVTAVWREADGAILLSTGEGLPRSLVEALASARAIITTDAPGNNIVVEDGINGFLVPPGDPKAAAAAIGRLAGDRQMLARMGEAARRHFENGFTAKDVTDAAVALYRRLLAQQAASL